MQKQLTDEQLTQINSDLLNLNLEKDRLVMELNKLPESPKTSDQKHQRVYLEGDLQTVKKMIGTIKR